MSSKVRLLPTGSARDMWAPLQTSTLFELFRPRTGLANIFESACPTLDNLRRHSFGRGKPEFTSTIFPNIPVNTQLTAPNALVRCLDRPCPHAKEFLVSTVYTNTTYRLHTFLLYFPHLSVIHIDHHEVAYMYGRKSDTEEASPLQCLLKYI
jgi:hypothetical protein